MYFSRYAVDRVTAIRASCGVQKYDIYVGGCKMGRVRAIHKKYGVPQSDILTYILHTFLLTYLLT
jgi:hypothetical protein